MARSLTLIFTALLVLTFSFSVTDADAQYGGSSYEIIPAPDLWYNDVDGIRVGVRFQGQVPGSFEDGPHRLDAGIWLGLWFPSLPVSYYLSFTEPIPAWSDFGSEASIQAISSIRTGYHNHGLGFNKRWQQGFDERKFREFSFRTAWENRFDDEYVPFPIIWSDDDKWLAQSTFLLQDENRFGNYTFRLTGTYQLLDESYQQIESSVTQRIPFNENWGLRMRGFFGAASSSTAPEYLYGRSSAPAIQWMNNGLTRAKGTIPQPWMESGNWQIAGGANLRGYAGQDVDRLMDENASPFLLNSIVSLNTELDYPNPIGSLFRQIPYLADFLRFRSYLFHDIGTSPGLVANETDEVFANAGAGFSLSLNIPDYLGKNRGFVFRYDIPFWLSQPGSEDHFKYRSLFAFGAVISF
ncbi:hypothetical protein DYD21_05620 [Rhodohalobacter sp. SW132]|uniref:hypothetical protein n=1 Tax=Rhodohalobacter sp. SW132 TaxID=2293433 RepID=UPI000E258C02|nr:hypothetical protein [Rhodohalobacter sp. SW132]REL38093.1 hypothetical protein DYD21_05620 [Rhodohalobacter sp. SW132]